MRSSCIHNDTAGGRGWLGRGGKVVNLVSILARSLRRSVGRQLLRGLPGSDTIRHIGLRTTPQQLLVSTTLARPDSLSGFQELLISLDQPIRCQISHHWPIACPQIVIKLLNEYWSPTYIELDINYLRITNLEIGLMFPSTFCCLYNGQSYQFKYFLEFFLLSKNQFVRLKWLEWDRSAFGWMKHFSCSQIPLEVL